MRTWKRCGFYPYEASDHGEIRRVGKKTMMAQCLSERGYLRVTMTVNGEEITRTAHALVAIAFIGYRPSGMHVNHIDGLKGNNRPDNLEYLTPAENSAHAARLGLTASGARHGRTTKPERTARGERVNTAKLTEKRVRQMRKMWAEGHGVSALMAKFGLGKSSTWAACVGRSWRHVA